VLHGCCVGCLPLTHNVRSATINKNIFIIVGSEKGMEKAVIFVTLVICNFNGRSTMSKSTHVCKYIDSSRLTIKDSRNRPLKFLLNNTDKTNLPPRIKQTDNSFVKAAKG